MDAHAAALGQLLDQLTGAVHQLDHGELIDLCLMQEEELDHQASAGALTDAKTLIGLQWLQKWRAGRWPLNWQTIDTAQG